MKFKIYLRFMFVACVLYNGITFADVANCELKYLIEQSDIIALVNVNRLREVDTIFTYPECGSVSLSGSIGSVTLSGTVKLNENNCTDTPHLVGSLSLSGDLVLTGSATITVGEGEDENTYTKSFSLDIP